MGVFLLVPNIPWRGAKHRGEEVVRRALRQPVLLPCEKQHTSLVSSSSNYCIKAAVDWSEVLSLQ